MNKKKIVFTFIGLITLLLSIIGVTVAYFIAGITGNEDASSLIVTAAKLSDLEYLPGEEINFDNVLPGWSRTQTFSVRTKSAHTVAMPYKVILNWSNSGITDMEYLLTSASGDVTITPKAINTVSENQHSVIAIGVFPASESIQTHTFTLTLRFRETGQNQDAQQGKRFNAIVTILTEQETQTLYYSNDYPNGTPSDWLLACNDESTRLNCQILADNTAENGKYKGAVQSDAMFAHALLQDNSETGLWLENRLNKTEDNKPVYFFRGNVTNNKVIFAGKYWRIVRINEDGTVRLILGGNTTTDGYAYDGNTQLTTEFNANMNSGYMYGNQCSSSEYNYEECHSNVNKSDLMNANESWWDNNLSSSTYNNKISSESIYCNNRKVYLFQETGSIEDEDYRITVWYDSMQRVFENRSVKPQFVCTQNNDKFTRTNAKNIGNQKMENKPVGFLTADEYVYAGGGMTAIYSSSNYLYQNAQVGPSSSYWWLGSPLIYAVPNLSFQSIALGKLDESEYSDELLVAIMPHGFRPVISLKADTIVTSGSSATAYNVD